MENPQGKMENPQGKMENPQGKMENPQGKMENPQGNMENSQESDDSEELDNSNESENSQQNDTELDGPMSSSEPVNIKNKNSTSRYIVGQQVSWYLGPSIVTNIYKSNGEYYYDIKHIHFELPCKVSESMLLKAELSSVALSKPLFNGERPSLIVVDNFYKDPMLIRNIALQQEFVANKKAYKGFRTHTRFLLPGVREEFERLIGARIRNWLYYPTNGCFQITKYTDPLVWHSDLQMVAGIIYLTPGPVNAGTSLWRDKKYGCRRPPFHEKERDRFKDDNERQKAQDEIYSEYNLLHQDNWELVDKVGSVFNRLLLWDSQMIHSASSYENFVGGLTDNDPSNSRLIQLFFFDLDI